MKKLLFIGILHLLTGGWTHAQTTPDNTSPLELKVTPNGSTKEINDGTAKVEVQGGTPPYQYKWSDRSTPLHADQSTGLIEGVPYTITVTDAEGNQSSKTFEVPAKSIPEIFNGAVQPAVNVLANILFWDPFTALGLYDPVIYVSQRQIAIPPSILGSDKAYTLKKYLVEEGGEIKKGDKVAIVANDEGKEMEVLAIASGTLEHAVAEGEVIHQSGQKGIVDEDAQVLATVNFSEPQPLLYPNGEQQKSSIPFIVIWLIAGSVFFTFRLGFVNIRGWRHSIGLARGKYDDPNAPGKITHFQAMTTAVSATVGLGNIAGVAIAISLGGPGATFWMFLAGFFAMSLKFAECFLGVKYRFINEEGRIFGGPTNYLRNGLKKRNLKNLGKFLAALFAVLCIGASFGGGNMLQSNQAFKIVSEQLPFLQGHGLWFGIGFALLVGAVIIGGINSIANVTEKVVPFMAGIYVLACMIIIGVNFTHIDDAFYAIYNGAFSADALKGGFIGVLIIGLQRAAFSSEAGLGSAAIAHSASKTNQPMADGFTALVEPFIDTMLICTMTALILIFSGVYTESSGMGGVELTAQAFGSAISWFPTVLAIAVFMFAFSTMVSWSYYGMRSWSYLFGRSKRSELTYKVLFLGFVVLGATVSLGAVLTFSDMMILAMSFPNIIGLYILTGEIRKDMKTYWKKFKKGELKLNPEYVKKQTKQKT